MRNALRDPTVMETIAERLRLARTRAKYASGSDAARAFGWPVSTYLGHENGDRKPSIETIKKYAKAFRADASFIAYGEGDISLVSDVKSFVKIRGIITNGGSIMQNDFELATGDLVTLDMKLPDDVFALTVAAGVISERFESGDLIIIKAGFSSDAGMLDRFVYVKLDDGTEYIRRISRLNGFRKYDLLPHTDDDATIKAKTIDEFGVIVLIIPGGFYSDLGVLPLVAQISGSTSEPG